MSSGSGADSVMTCPPADSIRALIHTVSASARMPWTPSSFFWSCAAWISCAHVTGLVMSSPAASATDLRYQRSWVLAQNGMATSSPFQVLPARALSTTPSLTRWATSAGTGARNSAWENSGMYGRVQAHQVDGAVLGREAAHELLALLGGLPRAAPSP